MKKTFALLLICYLFSCKNTDTFYYKTTEQNNAINVSEYIDTVKWNSERYFMLSKNHKEYLFYDSLIRVNLDTLLSNRSTKIGRDTFVVRKDSFIFYKNKLINVYFIGNKAYGDDYLNIIYSDRYGLLCMAGAVIERRMTKITIVSQDSAFEYNISDLIDSIAEQGILFRKDLPPPLEVVDK